MKITCPHCEKTINAPDKFAGRVVKCPGCKNEMELPTLEELGLAAAPPAPPPPAPAPQQAAPPPPPAPEPEPEPEDQEGLAGGEDQADEGVDERAATRRDSRRKSERRGSRKGSGRGGDGEGALKSYRRNMVILGLLLLLLAGACGVFAAFSGLVGLVGEVGAHAVKKAAEESGSPANAESAAVAVNKLKGIAAGGFTLAIVFAAGAFLNFILSICAFIKKNFANWLCLFVNLGMAGASGYMISKGGPVFAGITAPAGLVVLLALLNISKYGKVKAAGLDVSEKSAKSSSRGKRRSAGRKSDDGDEAESKPRAGGGISRRRTTGSRSRSRRRR